MFSAMLSKPADDVDELHMEGLDEIGADGAAAATSDQKKGAVKFAPPPPPTIKESKSRTTEAPPSRLKRACKYIKISLLIAVWILFSAFLLITPERKLDTRFLVVSPQIGKDYPVGNRSIKQMLGIGIKGAFAFEDELRSVEIREQEKPTYLTVVVQHLYYAANDALLQKVTLKDEWKIKMVAAKHLNSEPATIKRYTFDVKDSEEAPDHEYSTYQLHLTTDAGTDVALRIWFDYNPVNKRLGLIYGSLVLVFLYVLIIWEIINRTFASVIAASFAIGILAAFHSRPPMAVIISWIDVETMLLLFGMMILVAILSDSGVFDYMAVFAYDITKGAIWPLINCLCAFVYFSSAILDNVTMMLLVTPVTIRLAEVTNVNPVPILMCMVLFSNVGAALTPVGDPPNVIITSNPFVRSRNVNFGTFIMHMAPGVALATVQTYGYLRWHYRHNADLRPKESPVVEELRREIHAWQRAAEGITVFSKDEEIVRETLLNKVERLKERLEEELEQQRSRPSIHYEETLRNLKAEYPIRNKALLIKAGVVFIFVVILFALHSVPHLHHLSMGWTALLGALLLLALAEVDDMESILVRIEWSTLIFFASLFILMEALSELGVIEIIGGLVVQLVRSIQPEYRLTVAILIVLWVSGITSAFLANIPITTMMLKIIISLSQNKDLDLPLHPLVWALAFGACFGGNGTLIGASANVVCAGVVEQHGYKISFVDFFIVGFPVMLGNVLMATIYLLVAHVALHWH